MITEMDNVRSLLRHKLRKGVYNGESWRWLAKSHHVAAGRAYVLGRTMLIEQKSEKRPIHTLALVAAFFMRSLYLFRGITPEMPEYQNF